MDFDEAIRRHTEWKVKFRMAIFKKQHLDAATIAKDDCCPLGQWMHGPAESSFGDVPEFAIALAAHRAFHVEAGKVAEYINAENYADAERAMAEKSAYSANSHTVAVALAALKKATQT